MIDTEVKQKIAKAVAEAVAAERARCVAIARAGAHGFPYEYISDCFSCQTAKRIAEAIEAEE